MLINNLPIINITFHFELFPSSLVQNCVHITGTDFPDFTLNPEARGKKAFEVGLEQVMKYVVENQHYDNHHDKQYESGAGQRDTGTREPAVVTTTNCVAVD